MRLVLISVLAIIMVACAAVQPVPVKSGDTCFGCREVIADTKLAAELIDASGRAYVFDSPDCLAEYLAGHPEEKPKGIFVTDHESGKLIQAEEAQYVRFVKDPNRGQMGFAAFRRPEDAAAFGGLDRNATTLDWKGLLSAMGQ